MKKKLLSPGNLFLSLLFLTALAPSLSNALNVPGHYIVALKEGVSLDEVLGDHGLAAAHRYASALNGFAAAIPAAEMVALRSDPRVEAVEPDRVVALVPPVGPPRVHAQLYTSTSETLTTGIDRIDADLNGLTDVPAVGIAIIDTGIWKKHVDLNVAGGYNCTSLDTSKWNDDHGHGTHAAGIAAAKTNDNKGVRGVAPNARLFAVKVLNRSGQGFLSWVICGVDWVSANAAAKGIQVANMSLGFQGMSSALDSAISNSVKADATYAVAAGNSSIDAKGFSPANHPDVITVSAMGDSDGQCGGSGPNTSYGKDDTFASFSNFGSAVELAAPGVDIYSTWKGEKNNPNGLYATLSGTSMAAPHVAGAVAHYIATNPNATPGAVRNALIAAGVPQHNFCTGGGAGGFTGDSDHATHPSSSLDEALIYTGG